MRRRGNREESVQERLRCESSLGNLSGQIESVGILLEGVNRENWSSEKFCIREGKENDGRGAGCEGFYPTS